MARLLLPALLLLAACSLAACTSVEAGSADRAALVSGTKVRDGDALMVAVNTDASVRRQQKGEGRPFNALEDRMAVLSALEAVDFVVPFDDETPKDVIEAVTPHVLAKGEDWRDKGVVGREWVEDHGGQVVLVPLVAGRSTTNVVKKILEAGE